MHCLLLQQWEVRRITAFLLRDPPSAQALCKVVPVPVVDRSAKYANQASADGRIRLSELGGIFGHDTRGGTTGQQKLERFDQVQPGEIRYAPAEFRANITCHDRDVRRLGERGDSKVGRSSPVNALCDQVGRVEKECSERIESLGA
jgi:hypothetical protein